jgi:histidinol-phosphatase
MSAPSGVTRRDLLDFAVDLAWRAGRVTLSHFQGALSIEVKADGTIVTAADREAERLCRDLIARRFPEDGLLGEEFGEARAGSARRWVIDPIDGTASFARGVPLYGVLIAVEEGDDAVVGVLHFPALGETLWAAKGEGCWWNGRPARVSAVSRLEEATLLTTDAEKLRPESDGGAGYERLRRATALVRTWGDCYGHALVATGRAEIMLDRRAAIWDAAPLRPVIEEAGGVFTDWDGNAGHRGGSAVSTNGVLAVEARRALHQDA